MRIVHACTFVLALHCSNPGSDVARPESGPDAAVVDGSENDVTRDSGPDGDDRLDALPEAAMEAEAGPPEPQVTDTPPADEPFAIDVEGQTAWIHDEGHGSGYFHTYDDLEAGGAGDAARKVHVFLPRSYPASGARYPVLYMNDGDTAFFPGGAAGKTWDVAARLSTLYASSSVPEIIVVAVHPLDREVEYTHAYWAPGRGCCGLAAYADYLADALKSFVDGHYRTRASASDTCVMGSSHGGLAAFYTAVVRRDRFGHAAAMSSSFWAGIDLVGTGSLAESSLLAMTEEGLQDPAHPRLWIDWGLVRTGGEHNSIIEAMATDRGREMAELLRGSFGYEDGVDLYVYEDPDGEHEESSWGRRFELALPALMGAGR